MTFRHQARLLLLGLLWTALTPAARAAGEAKDWLFIPALGYTTDTEFLFGAAVMRFYGCEGGEGEDCRRSNLLLQAIFTQKKQRILELAGDQYWRGLRHNLVWSLQSRRFPSTFYGLGRNTPLDQAEDFTPQTLQFGAGYSRRFTEHWALGLEAEIAEVEFLEVASGGAVEAGQPAGTHAGLGLRLILDDRDGVWFPRRGRLMSVFARVYRRDLGGDRDWEHQGLNLRQYLALGALRGQPVLALQLLLDHAPGDVPFYELPSLGGDNELRGYPGARFRDHARLLGQMELRFSELWGPLGAVGFLGYGDVAPVPGELALGQGKLGWGLGLRYLYDAASGLHLRMDFGRGDGEESFTITVGEAF